MEVIRNLVFTNAMVFNHVAVDGLGVCELVVWVGVLTLSLRSLYSNSKQYSTDN